MGCLSKHSWCEHEQHLATLRRCSGPVLLRQGRPRLLPAKAAWGDEHDAFLALSSEAGRCTAVLDIRGTHFRPADALALDRGAATLAFAAVPGGWLVQATPHVRAGSCCTLFFIRGNAEHAQRMCIVAVHPAGSLDMRRHDTILWQPGDSN